MDYKNIDFLNSHNSIDNLDIDSLINDLAFDTESDYPESYENEKSDDKQNNVIEEESDYPVSVFFIDLSKTYMNRISWQWHPEMEIIIVNHGKLKLSTHKSHVILGAGQGVVINSNIIHSIDPVDNDPNVSFYSTMFSPAFLFGKKESSLSEKYQLPVTTNKHFQYLSIDENDPNESELLDLVNGVIADNIIKHFGYELSTKSKLCSFWIKLSSMITPATTTKKTSKAATLDEARAKEIITYIESNYSKKVTLDEIAEYVHLSKSECCRCFKRALNLTPVEYLMKYRIYQSALILQNDEKMPASYLELSNIVGFNNASYFNKVFREYMGCTPSVYRKKVKSDPGYDPFNSTAL